MSKRKERALGTLIVDNLTIVWAIDELTVSHDTQVAR